MVISTFGSIGQTTPMPLSFVNLYGLVLLDIVPMQMRDINGCLRSNCRASFKDEAKEVARVTAAPVPSRQPPEDIFRATRSPPSCTRALAGLFFAL
jgi:hypothetical protein